MEISFCSHPNTDKVIATIFGTWHDSWAVVACAKFCCEMVISNWIRAKWNFHRIWIVMEKSLVKWAQVLMWNWILLGFQTWWKLARKWPISAHFWHNVTLGRKAGSQIDTRDRHSFICSRNSPKWARQHSYVAPYISKFLSDLSHNTCPYLTNSPSSWSWSGSRHFKWMTATLTAFSKQVHATAVCAWIRSHTGHVLTQLGGQGPGLVWFY